MATPSGMGVPTSGIPAGGQMGTQSAHDPFLVGNQPPNFAASNAVADDPFLNRMQPGAPDAGKVEVANDPLLIGAQPVVIPVSVGNDLFLTGGHALEKNVANDPFLTHSMPAQRAQREDVASDPFLIAPHAPVKTPKNLLGTFGKVTRHMEESCSLCMGRTWKAGGRSCDACGRELDAIPMDTILMPWLMFVFFLVLGLVLRRRSELLVSLITVIFVTSQAVVLLGWLRRGRPSLGVSRANRAVISVAMAFAGLAVANTVWNHYMRQYWWMFTGVQFNEAKTTATTPALSRADAAWIHFAGPLSGKTSANASVVDTTRAAGYKDGSMYCAAPVLSSSTLGSTIIRVNYWAVGIDCCQGSGSFSCDAARESTGEFGVPLVEGGMPCAGCNADRFASAIAKAEALYGMTSAPGALTIRWVTNAKSVRQELGHKVIVICLFSSMVAFLAVLFLAVLANQGPSRKQ
eukprot:TRINITY_DN63741_c0_g1_i1.p1 TRINITY_DN63741_c0_g1~~TRINITY_DN63741_c0_g1_i1.p1  ORF type:complete len:462 (-),score=55.88 TRINITY_DN63741_c0_g1_i1:54-1439(-)